MRFSFDLTAAWARRTERPLFTVYFYFSPYDEPWKDQFGGVEPYWGLMDSNKVGHSFEIPVRAELTLPSFGRSQILKDITLPNCQAP